MLLGGIHTTHTQSELAFYIRNATFIRRTVRGTPKARKSKVAQHDGESSSKVVKQTVSKYKF